MAQTLALVFVSMLMTDVNVCCTQTDTSPENHHLPFVALECLILGGEGPPRDPVPYAIQCPQSIQKLFTQQRSAIKHTILYIVEHFVAFRIWHAYLRSRNKRIQAFDILKAYTNCRRCMQLILMHLHYLCINTLCERLN